MKIINADSIDEIYKVKENFKRLDQSTTKTKKFRGIVQNYMGFLDHRQPQL